MIHGLLKKVYLRLPKKQGKILKDFYYNEFEKFRWIPKNLFVFFITPFIRNRRIKNLNFFEQKFYSQCGEDGIIKIIFDKIRATNKFCIEFGIWPRQGNTIYLRKKGWKCLWMDGNGDGKKIKKEFIIAENVEKIFKKYDVPKEFDLLSIDIDSNDYWIWKAINKYSPRVIIIEYNAHIPPNESKTVKYDINFKNDGTDYYGASLLALAKLGKSKGYTLIGCSARGINAFFVRDDLIKDNFKIKNIKELYRPPKYGRQIRGRYIGYPKSNKKMISV
jgi:hypothetical protein